MDKSREEHSTEGNENSDEAESSQCAPDSNNQLSELAAVAAIAELLEVALHAILCVRQVYPFEIFERRVKFGIPVFRCTDRTINEYVSEVVKAIGEELVEDAVERIIISIHQPATPLEKFIFSFDRAKVAGTERSRTEVLPLETVQRQMRSMLMKLNAIDAQLLPLCDSDDLSFSVMMQLREGGKYRISEDKLGFDNLLIGPERQQTGNHSRGTKIHNANLLHVIKTGYLSVCHWLAFMS
ncbi:DNA-binding protein [Fomitiporia mediterranea MF3/22]|uniref:DNA-binding protein n=1 Tax=Fomitiporia mediterranea (strain MF3/22) TaxID=694068 RepID=UPI000440796E|nr:DNA-binding protein [Fomitiporia mediterranea MF3/22]EJD01951.1 DNA-binding protein [Fomitiporia mediterranea MF3/22]